MPSSLGPPHWNPRVLLRVLSRSPSIRPVSESSIFSQKRFTNMAPLRPCLRSGHRHPPLACGGASSPQLPAWACLLCLSSPQRVKTRTPYRHALSLHGVPRPLTTRLSQATREALPEGDLVAQETAPRRRTAKLGSHTEPGVRPL